MDESRWVERISADLDQQGFSYHPKLSSDAEEKDVEGTAVLRLARALGRVFHVDEDATSAAVVTAPAKNAPAHAPFNRAEGIGWHNDFSTWPKRPTTTLIWIARGDPAGAGDWRVASVEAVLRRLSPDMPAILRRSFPFGYSDDSHDPRHFPLLTTDPKTGRSCLRFYGRALREGAAKHEPAVMGTVEAVVESIHRAADAVGSTLSAHTGSLLVVDNRYSLHDRLAQTVEGPNLRQAVLYFLEERIRRP